MELQIKSKEEVALFYAELIDENRNFKNCDYFPCHNNVEDCRFCYCPIYPCKKEKRGGKFIKSPAWGDNTWSCDDCDIVHNLRVAERLDKFINRSK